MKEKEPWEQPVTEEGRDALIALVERYRASNEQRELGNTLCRLAHAMKHVGPSDGKDAFLKSAQYGAEAVQILRQTDDRNGLARALRVAAVPFVYGVDHRELLEESLAIAREIGDKEQEGWTLYRMTRAQGVEGVKLQQAMDCFESCACKSGIATCLLSMAVEGINSGKVPRSMEPFDRAAQLFEEAGYPIEAARARTFGEAFGKD